MKGTTRLFTLFWQHLPVKFRPGQECYVTFTLSSSVRHDKDSDAIATR